MGLAAKLAAAQAGAGQMASQYGAQQQQGGYKPPGGQLPYPGQSSAAPPTANQGQRPPSGQYGQPSYGQGPQSSSTYGGQPQQGQYGAPSGPPPPGNYQPPGGAPPSGQYGAPSGGYGQPQQQSQYGQSQSQYGQPPQQQQYGQPPQQQQYGQPPAPGSRPGAGAPAGGAGGIASDPRAILSILQQCATDQKIQTFFPPQRLEQIANQVAQSGALSRVAAEWKLPMEIASDLVKLALFDTILYLDDSGSMRFEEGGSRIDDLKLIVSRVAYATSLFDADGIQVRFMNAPIQGNGIRNEGDANNLISQIKFSGLTPMGTQLDAKVIQPLILQPARSNRLDKPVLIIIVTDGEPGGEDRGKLASVIGNAANELSRTRYGSDALSIQLAQVGNDTRARAFLEEIDKHPHIGGLVDVTSNFELEADEMMRANPPVDLTPDLWIVKMLLGGIDSSYDTQDE